MKKILLATTALVAFAGAASAEVALTGYAEMGIFGGSEIETQFFNDIDIKFALTGETDSGLAFGATVDLDEVFGDGFDPAGGDAPRDSIEAIGYDGSGRNKSSVFVSGAFGKLTMGDTDGAVDWALSEMSTITSIADDHTTHVGFNGNDGLDESYDGQVVRYEYAFDAFAVAASLELDDTGLLDPVIGLGATYTLDLAGTDVALGLGYQQGQAISTAGPLPVIVDRDALGVSALAKFAGGFRGGVSYTTFTTDGFEDVDHVGVLAGYAIDAFSVEINYGNFSSDNAEDRDAFGIAANYDLGGGAVVMFGYGSDVRATSTNDDGDLINVGDQDQFSLGLGLSF